MSSETLRPRDLALLLLASENAPPRQRARDQQADRAGLELRRRVLDRLAALDPAPADLVATLVQMVEELGEPTGPTRAIALSVREELETLQREGVGYFLDEAVRANQEEPRRGRRVSS